MGLSVVVRCHYGHPLEKRLFRFEEHDTILSLFNRLRAVRDQTSDEREVEVGGWFGEMLRFGGPWTELARLRQDLEAHYGAGDEEDETVWQVWLDPEGEALEVPTEHDGVLQIAHYLFTDRFARRHSGRVAFLLHEPWALPTTTNAPPSVWAPAINRSIFERCDPMRSFTLLEARGDGSAFFLHEGLWDKNGDPLACGGQYGAIVRVDGARLPDLPRFLTGPADPSWPLSLLLLRSQLRIADGENAIARALGRLAQLPLVGLACLAYHDDLRAEMLCGPPEQADRAVREIASTLLSLEVNGEFWPRPVDGSGSRVACASHVAQASLQAPPWPDGVFEPWLLFDDLWARAHAPLAESLIRFFATRRVLRG